MYGATLQLPALLVFRISLPLPDLVSCLCAVYPFLLGEHRSSRANNTNHDNIATRLRASFRQSGSLHAVCAFPDLGPGLHRTLSIVGNKTHDQTNSSRLQRPLFVMKHIRSASAMPCNVSPHLSPNITQTLSFSRDTTLRHKSPRLPIGKVDLPNIPLGTGHCSKIENGGADGTTCSGPHLFLYFSSPVARDLGTRAGCTALSLVTWHDRDWRSGVPCSSALGTGLVGAFEVNADTGSLPRIGAG